VLQRSAPEARWIVAGGKATGNSVQPTPRASAGRRIALYHYFFKEHKRVAIQLKRFGMTSSRNQSDAGKTYVAKHLFAFNISSPNDKKH